MGENRATAAPAWADAGIICPWTIYLCYGDTRILDEHYPAMARYLEFLQQANLDGTRRGYGDWLNHDDADPQTLISSLFRLRCAPDGTHRRDAG